MENFREGRRERELPGKVAGKREWEGLRRRALFSGIFLCGHSTRVATYSIFEGIDGYLLLIFETRGSI